MKQETEKPFVEEKGQTKGSSVTSFVFMTIAASLVLLGAHEAVQEEGKAKTVIFAYHAGSALFIFWMGKVLQYLKGIENK